MPTTPKLSPEIVSVLDKMKQSSVVADILHRIGTGEEAPELSLDDDGSPSIDYLSISSEDPTKISYLTPDRTRRIRSASDDESVLWTSAWRYHGRPASVVARLLKSVSPKDLEVFGNMFRALASVVKFEFKVVSGESIRHWYHEGTYVRGCGGSLGQSCMKHPFCQEFLDLYVDNDEVISMLIMVDKKGMLLGRALLWEFEDLAGVISADGPAKVRVMDRIYTANDEELQHHFKMWAQENGWLYKHMQKWNNSLDLVGAGKVDRRRLSLKLKHFRYDKYPYMDTFKFMNGRSGILSNFLTPGCTKTLCCADGSVQRADWLCEDYLDGLYHHAGEMAPITYDKETIGLPDKSSRMTHQTNVRYSAVNDTHILKPDCMHDPIIGDFVFIGEYAHLNNKERMVELVKERARLDFQAFVSLACKNMTFAQVMARHAELQAQWRGDPSSVAQAVDSYFA